MHSRGKITELWSINRAFDWGNLFSSSLVSQANCDNLHMRPHTSEHVLLGKSGYQWNVLNISKDTSARVPASLIRLMPDTTVCFDWSKNVYIAAPLYHTTKGVSCHQFIGAIAMQQSIFAHQQNGSISIYISQAEWMQNNPPNLLSISKCLIIRSNDFPDWNMMYEKNETHWVRTATCTNVSGTKYQMIDNKSISNIITNESDLVSTSNEAHWVISSVLGPLNHKAKSGSISPLSSIEIRPDSP